MTEQLALQQKLHTPERLANESYEDYKKRRKDSKELNKLAAFGKPFHISEFFTEETGKDGQPFLKRHTHTYVKP
jgi:hypothetical protein